LKSVKVITLVFAYGISLDEVAEEWLRCVVKGQKLGIVVSRREGEYPGSE
jgi:hypothetical protein